MTARASGALRGTGARKGQMSKPKVYPFETFWNDHAKWSQKTFGTDLIRGPEGPLRHLLKEAQEAIDAKSKADEIADCFLLVCDAARRYGMSPDSLIAAAQDKLEINKRRKWPKTTDMSAPVEHVRVREMPR